MGFGDTTKKKIKQYFSRELEGRIPELYNIDTGSARHSGFGSFDYESRSGFKGLEDYLRIDSDLMARYRDYEEMDEYPEISAAMDIFADDATQIDTQTGKTLEIEASDKNVHKRLTELYERNVRVDDNIWGMARTLVKYGNDFDELILKDKEGILGMNPLPTPSVRRIETDKGGLLGFVYDLKHKFDVNTAGANNVTQGTYATPVSQGSGSEQSPYYNGSSASPEEDNFFEPHELIHFRLRARYRNSVYGFSVAESARWIWRRLALLEDAALIYKVTRAPARYAYYVDVGDLPAKQALAYVDKVRQRFKKHKFINPATNKLDLRLNPLSFQDDFFVPTRQGRRSSEIDVLSGPDYQAIEDLQYFQNKLFAALKVPKIFLNFEEGTGSRTVSAEDVRFARSVMRIQRELRTGFKRMGDIHLIATGIDPAAVDYEVYMTTPSSIFEMAQLEVQNSRADLASRMQEMVSLRWVQENVFGMNDETIEQITKQRFDDRMFDSNVELEGRKAEMEMERQFEESVEVPGFEGVRRSAKPMSILSHTGQEVISRRSNRAQVDGRLEAKLYQENKKNHDELIDKVHQLIQNDAGMRKKLYETGTMVRELTGLTRAQQRKISA